MSFSPLILLRNGTIYKYSYDCNIIAKHDDKKNGIPLIKNSNHSYKQGLSLDQLKDLQFSKKSLINKNIDINNIYSLNFSEEDTASYLCNKKG